MGGRHEEQLLPQRPIQQDLAAGPEAELTAELEALGRPLEKARNGVL